MSDTREQIAKTVQGALGDAPERDPIATELECLWNDLDHAIHSAANGHWSLACENAVTRIVWLSRHTGRPTPWRHVPVTLLANGVYQAINEAMGFDASVPSRALLEARRYVEQQVA